MTNEDLGYGEYFEGDKINQGFGDFIVARVVSEQRGQYNVKNSTGEYQAKIRGKQMLSAASRYDYPVVGDWVVITVLNDSQAVIDTILKRKTILVRGVTDSNKNKNKDIQIISSNIDVAFIVQAVDRDYSLNRFERYVAIAENGGVEPVLILNKKDLVSEAELNVMIEELAERFNGIRIVTTSVVDKESGLIDLTNILLKGKTYCFLGSSGVGKSSIIKMLTNNENIKTLNISEHSNRGRHTTTSRQMYFIENGSILIDNPGVREVGVTSSASGMKQFDDITEMARLCKFTNCTHTQEPGCAVLEMVSSGEIDKEKYSNYINIKKESEFYELSDSQKRQKDKNFGKMVKNVLKIKKNKKLY